MAGKPPSLEHDTALDLGDLCRAAVEATADAIVLLDERRMILFANSATSRLFRYAASELIGLPLTTLLPQAPNECYEMELVGLAKDGEELSLELSMQLHTVNERRILAGVSTLAVV